MKRKKQTRKIVNRPPCEARSFNQICELPRDHDSCGKFWWIIDEVRITLCEQASGESPVQKITLPRHVFEKVARWYLTGSKTKPKDSTP